ncbi:hypothetical protein L226DRAFT_559219 [Lentinus tigrinus ALCF2SS1-7]|uniref:uncharacterized protein n=1 Tax=Lentinus tigrinus ALCF2SS1-7 TaxID=1328758 RepID=UPI0011661BB3|nr:hypothetical protein L226DRAFT_559219 [Lentinus tigrinus ALCF2SS1-7]
MLAAQSSARTCPCRCFQVSASLPRAEGVVALNLRYRHFHGTWLRTSSTGASPWDSIFEAVKDTTALMHHSIPHVRNLRCLPVGRADGPEHPRTISTTHHESQTIADMFNVVFEGDFAASSEGTAGVDQHSAAMDKSFSRLRRIKRPPWTSEVDEELDRKMVDMELCETDIQLLMWAMQEVFGEFRRYEGEARRTVEVHQAGSSDFHTSPSSRRMLSALQHYPHLLVALMCTFRDRYKDPHLAMSMFEHARDLSIASFVYGCTTPVYNELIETRWRSFRDLRGVCDVLEEMWVNGVETNHRTRLLAETIRHEIGERTFWQEESSIGSGEAWRMVSLLESLVVRGRKQKRTRSSDAETGKVKAKESTQDKWRFNEWPGSPFLSTRTRRMRT